MQLAHDHTHQQPSPIYIHLYIHYDRCSVTSIPSVFFFPVFSPLVVLCCVLFRCLSHLGTELYALSSLHAIAPSSYAFLSWRHAAWCQLSFPLCCVSVFFSQRQPGQASQQQFAGRVRERKKAKANVSFDVSFAMKQANKLASIKASRNREKKNRLRFLGFLRCRSTEREETSTTTFLPWQMHIFKCRFHRPDFTAKTLATVNALALCHFNITYRGLVGAGDGSKPFCARLVCLLTVLWSLTAITLVMGIILAVPI